MLFKKWYQRVNLVSVCFFKNILGGEFSFSFLKTILEGNSVSAKICRNIFLLYIPSWVENYSPVQRLGLLQKLEGSKFSWLFSQCRSRSAESDWKERWSYLGWQDKSPGWRTQRGCPDPVDQCQGRRNHPQPIQYTVNSWWLVTSWYIFQK